MTKSNQLKVQRFRP